MMDNLDLRCEGFVFTDDEMQTFHEHFYSTCTPQETKRCDS